MSNPVAQMIGNKEKGIMQNLTKILEKWRNFSGESKALAGMGLLGVLVASAVVILLWTSSQQYVPLYGKQEAYNKASIVELLEKEGVDFHIDPESGDLLVPKSKLTM